MKNPFKIGLLGVVIAGTVAACDPASKLHSTKDPGDTTTKAKDTTKAPTDTTKKDTSKKQ